MTSPYSSNLLQQPVEDTRSAPRTQPHAPTHARSVTHVVAQPQPMYAPIGQPAYAPVHVESGRSGGGAGSAIVLGLLVVLLGAVALVGAYFAANEASPSAREAAVVQNLAARDGFRAGRDRGVDVGRQQALEHASSTTALRVAAARERAYAAAFRRGERAGRASYRAPRFTGYRGGYRAPRFGGFGNLQVTAALGQAQQLANFSGAPVDVEIY